MQLFFLVIGLTLLYLAATNKLAAVLTIILTDTKSFSGGGSGGGSRVFK